ncbi:hypothetical protein DXG01_014566 [Tephrocybe rancida]|nr:hypothetical protein DXG01_014566 [Tephrocybe rancida]
MALGQRLSALLEDLHTSDSLESWKQTETTSQALANGLRTRSDAGDLTNIVLVDNHSSLGATALPRTLASLLNLALHGLSIPPDEYTAVVFELLRVAANLVMDHDDNRGRLLEAGLPQAIVSLLEGYAERAPPPPHTRPIDLSIPHLKVIKTSIGALLNASVGYDHQDAVQFRLISLEAPLTILKLSTAIYPTGYWADISAGAADSVVGDEDEWALRSGLSQWAWLAISELKDVKDDCDPSPTRSLFDLGSQIAKELTNADLGDLQESCTLIETSALDVDNVRSSLARGLRSPAEHNSIPCLSIILDFIEEGTYPNSWSYTVTDETERKTKEKAFNICKAALIKAVVEVAGEDNAQESLWDDSNPEMPGGIFVHRMVDWLQRFVKDLDSTAAVRNPGGQSISDREDMAICASLALGNLARKEEVSTALVSHPYAVVPILASPQLLSPSTDIKVKHGVIALLKHLAQAPSSALAIHSALGRAEVVRRIAATGVWDEKADAMADVVQLSAIGVAKHMASANVEHAYALMLPSSRSPSSPTGLSQILALVKRTDSVPIKSEGSRVLVNIVRMLWASKVPVSTTSDAQPVAANTVDKHIQEKQRKHNAALRAILTPESASVLTRLVGASGKYPLLVHEGLVALTLFSIPKEGALLVLDALTVPLGVDVPPESPIDSTSPPTTASDVGSPDMVTPGRSRVQLNIPRHPLDMLLFTLKNVDNPANFPVEVRANVCTFLIQLSKNTNGDKLEQVKEAVHPVLEPLLASEAVEDKLKNAIRSLHAVWS